MNINNLKNFYRIFGELCNRHERFHASGGVCPPTVLWGFGSLSPARTFVDPPPAWSRHHVMCNARATEQQCGLEENKGKFCATWQLGVIGHFYLPTIFFKFRKVGFCRVRYAHTAPPTPRPKMGCAIFRLCPPTTRQAGGIKLKIILLNLTKPKNRTILHVYKYFLHF